jgi:hypothetical protein
LGRRQNEKREGNERVGEREIERERERESVCVLCEREYVHVRVPDSEGRGNTNRHSDLFYRTIFFLQNPV